MDKARKENFLVYQSWYYWFCKVTLDRSNPEPFRSLASMAYDAGYKSALEENGL